MIEQIILLELSKASYHLKFILIRKKFQKFWAKDYSNKHNIIMIKEKFRKIN
jgi:hypothetical protein